MSLLKQSFSCLSLFLILSLSLGHKVTHREGGFVNYLKNLFSMHKIRPVRSYTLYGKTDGPVDAGAGLPHINPPKDFKEPAEYLQHLAYRQSLRNSAYTGAGKRASNGMESFYNTNPAPSSYNRPIPTTMNMNNNYNNEVQRNQMYSQYYPSSYNWYPNQAIQGLPRQNDVNNNNNRQQQYYNINNKFRNYQNPNNPSPSISYQASPVRMNQPQFPLPIQNWKQSSFNGVRGMESPATFSNANANQNNVNGKDDTDGNTVQKESSNLVSSESESNSIPFPLEDDSQNQINYNDNNNEIIDENDLPSSFSGHNMAFDTVHYNINSDDDLLSTD